MLHLIVEKHEKLERRLQVHHEKQRSELQQRRARYEAKQQRINHRMEQKEQQRLREKHRTAEQLARKNDIDRRTKSIELSKMWAAKQASLLRMTEQRKIQEKRAKQEAKKREALVRERERRRKTILIRNMDAEKEKADSLRDRWAKREQIVAKQTSERREKNRLLQLRRSLHAKQRREKVMRKKKAETRAKQRDIMVRNKFCKNAFERTSKQRICAATHMTPFVFLFCQQKIENKRSKAEFMNDMKNAVSEQWKKYKSGEWLVKKELKDKRERIKVLSSPAVGQYDIMGKLGKGGLSFSTKMNTRLDILQHRARSFPGPGEYDTTRSSFRNPLPSSRRSDQAQVF